MVNDKTPEVDLGQGTLPISGLIRHNLLFALGGLAARRRRPLIRQCEIPAAREYVHVGPVDFDLKLAPLAIPLVVLRVVDQLVAVARIVESASKARLDVVAEEEGSSPGPVR